MLFRLSLVTLSLVLVIGACLLLVRQSDDTPSAQAPASGTSTVSLRRLEAALRRDLASPYPWCDLGEALLDAQQVEKARHCMRRAVQLGPSIPNILMRAANLHFRLNEPLAALPYTTRILELTAEHDALVFGYYQRYVPNPANVLPHLKRNRRGLHSYLRHLASRGQADAAGLAWAEIVRLRAADDRLAWEYVDFLIGRGQHRQAAQTWAGYLGNRRGDYPQSNLLFNGGFESDPTGAALDWRIGKLEGVEVRFDATPAKEGRRALRIAFPGTANLNYAHIGQSAYVRPGTLRFQAFVKTEALTTDQGVFFRVFDPNAPGRLSLETEPLRGANDWTLVESVFTVPAGTALVSVLICRKPSRKFDNKIKGVVWIDSVRLEPVQ